MSLTNAMKGVHAQRFNFFNMLRRVSLEHIYSK